jgi:hypothetical protein
MSGSPESRKRLPDTRWDTDEVYLEGGFGKTAAALIIITERVVKRVRSLKSKRQVEGGGTGAQSE